MCSNSPSSKRTIPLKATPPPHYCLLQTSPQENDTIMEVSCFHLLSIFDLQPPHFDLWSLWHHSHQGCQWHWRWQIQASHILFPTHPFLCFVKDFLFLTSGTWNLSTFLPTCWASPWSFVLEITPLWCLDFKVHKYPGHFLTLSLPL